MTKVISLLYLENRIGETKERNQSLPLKKQSAFQRKQLLFGCLLPIYWGKEGNHVNYDFCYCCGNFCLFSQ